MNIVQYAGLDIATIPLVTIVTDFGAQSPLLISQAGAIVNANAALNQFGFPVWDLNANWFTGTVAAGPQLAGCVGDPTDPFGGNSQTLEFAYTSTDHGPPENLGGPFGPFQPTDLSQWQLWSPRVPALPPSVPVGAPVYAIIVFTPANNYVYAPGLGVYLSRYDHPITAAINAFDYYAIIEFVRGDPCGMVNPPPPPSAGNYGPDGVWIHHHRIGTKTGSYHQTGGSGYLRSPYSIPVHTVASALPTTDNPRQVRSIVDHRDHTIIIYTGDNGVAIRVSYDDGRLWTMPQVLFDKGKNPTIAVNPEDGTKIFAAFIADFDKSQDPPVQLNTGTIQARVQHSGDPKPSDSFTIQALDTNTNQLADLAVQDGTFHISASAEGPDRWVLTCMKADSSLGVGEPGEIVTFTSATDCRYMEPVTVS